MAHARHKKITRADIVGEQAVNLIQKIVLDMGFLFFPRLGPDKGIDGYIEIADPITGEAKNCLIYVQSKGRTDFPNENAQGFDFYCEEADINYWLSGNAPVILVCSHPSTHQAYWISIKDYFADPVIRRNRKAHFDKQANRFDEHCRDALLKLGLPRNLGIYFAPAPKHEKLYSNLLHVGGFAKMIYVANTDYTRPGDIWAKFRQMQAEPGGEFFLRSKTIISFNDLASSPWDQVCEQGNVEAFDSDEWAYSQDPIRQREFVELLNRSLVEKLKPDIVFQRKYRYYYFAPTSSGANRSLPYKSLKNTTSRWVFRAYPRQDDPNKIAYYRHSAFFGQFLRFGDEWFLEITPHYRFTTDGRHISLYNDEGLKTIKRLERNPAVLGQIITWAEYLKDKPNPMFPSYPHLSFGTLVTAELDAGLNDSNWLGTEDEKTSKKAKLRVNTLPLIS
jgi:hypothetical protein